MYRFNISCHILLSESTNTHIQQACDNKLSIRYSGLPRNLHSMTSPGAREGSCFV